VLSYLMIKPCAVKSVWRISLTNMKKTIALALGVLTMSTAANAIVYDAAVDGVNAPAGSTFTGSGSLFAGDWNGTWELGIGWREIDINNFLLITFDQPQLVTQLSLGALYMEGPYSDPNEMARITFNGSTTYRLQAVGETSASWDGQGTVSNLSEAGYESTDGGAWSIVNPFGSVPVTSILLEAEHVDTRLGGDSDYGLNGFRTSAVPDGGSALSLLGVALCSLAAWRRKLRA